MRKTTAVAVFWLILAWSASGFAGSFMERAGQDLWYAWHDTAGKRNGYSHDTFTKTTQNGKPALGVATILHNQIGPATNDIRLNLVSSELEPMVKFSIEATETGKSQTYTTTLKGKPDGLAYRFEVNHNGTKKTVVVPRERFDYFDFEDHYLYSGIVKGKNRSVRVLNSLTLAVEKRTIHNLGDASVELAGRRHACEKYSVKTNEYETTLWFDKTSRALVQQTFSNGSSIRLSTRKEATAP